MPQREGDEAEDCHDWELISGSSPPRTPRPLDSPHPSAATVYDSTSGDLGGSSPGMGGAHDTLGESMLWVAAPPSVMSVASSPLAPPSCSASSPLPALHSPASIFEPPAAPLLMDPRHGSISSGRARSSSTPSSNAALLAPPAASATGQRSPSATGRSGADSPPSTWPASPDAVCVQLRVVDGSVRMYVSAASPSRSPSFASLAGASLSGKHGTGDWMAGDDAKPMVSGGGRRTLFRFVPILNWLFPSLVCLFAAHHVLKRSLGGRAAAPATFVSGGGGGGGGDLTSWAVCDGSSATAEFGAPPMLVPVPAPECCHQASARVETVGGMRLLTLSQAT